MKKFALGVGIVALTIFSFLYIQLYRAQSSIAAQLAQQNIAVQSVNLSLFPPALSLEKVQSEQFSVQKIESQLNLLPLFYGNINLSSLQLKQLKLSNKAQNLTDIKMHFSALSLTQLLAKKIILNGNNQISIKLEKPFYGKNKTFDFTFTKANIDLSNEKSSLIQFVNAKLNNQSLGYIEAHGDFNKPLKRLVTYIKPQCNNNCLAVVNYQSVGDQSMINFSGKEFPFKPLLSLLSFPESLSGYTDFKINLGFKNSEITQGKFNFQAKNGEIIGINLLDIVSQYFPINYSNDLLANKELNTQYEQFQIQLSLLKDQLNAEKFELKTPTLLGSGTGVVSLNQMQCDINLTVRSTNKNYQNLILPIRFFGDCYSPQYKFNFTREFRHQFIDIIKEKLH